MSARYLGLVRSGEQALREALAERPPADVLSPDLAEGVSDSDGRPGASPGVDRAVGPRPQLESTRTPAYPRRILSAVGYAEAARACAATEAIIEAFTGILLLPYPTSATAAVLSGAPPSEDMVP